jgi:hypothetical protein
MVTVDWWKPSQWMMNPRRGKLMVGEALMSISTW